ncbi:ABC transporter ATP-binding protein [Leucobacter soli]|uniref:ABC transporter ATP-binding protein n=1 Tax=Leucobacter soli TaxID=2812850 RepID=UPI00361D6AFA
MKGPNVTNPVKVSVKNLAKSFATPTGTVEVIRDLTFDVFEGELVSIVGPSGVGKTTLLRCLSGLDTLSRGEARLDDRLIDGPPNELALVFQDYSRSLMPWLTVRKNVELPLRHLGLSAEERHARSDEALAAVGLAQAAQKYPWQLSGGMQQRVAIARAVAYRPEVLIMDEPFASVDAQTRFELEDLCLRIRDEYRMTVMVVTHDIDEAVYLSDRIVVIGKKPAEVMSIVDVPLAFPRDQIRTRADVSFGELRGHVLELIQAAH